MINFKAIGQRVRNMRKIKGLTQEKLAELLDISTEHLSRIETGAYRPSLALIQRICEIFEIEESTLMFGTPADISENKVLADKIDGLSNEKKRAISLIIDLIT